MVKACVGKFCFPCVQSAVEVCGEAVSYFRHADFCDSRLFGGDLSLKDENIWTFVTILKL